MFTDIQGYTALMQKDEDRAISMRNRHREVLEAITQQNQGKVLQYFGDGSLSIYNSATEAVQCGIDLQVSFRQDPTIPIRIGIHLGEIIYDQEDIIGEGIGLASQIESLGQPGSVLISDKINHALKNQGSFSTEFLGEFHLQNIAGTQKIYAVNHPGLVVPNLDQVTERLEKDASGRSRAGKRSRLVIFGAVLISLIILSIIGTRVWWIGPAPEKSLAVLPLANLSNDPDQEYFSDGLTTEIINHLAQIEDLKVISRTSIMNYKNSNKSIRQIGNELGVSNILTGSVQKHGDEIRLSAQLTHVETDHNLWAETYDRKLTEIFSIQTDLALNIAKTLEATLYPAELSSDEEDPISDFGAYNSYLRSLHAFESYSAEGYYEAVELLKETIASDPEFAAAYGRLALVYVYLASWAGDLPPQEAKEIALPMAHKALEMDQNLYQAHTALALIHFWFDWNFEEAEIRFKRALEIAPGAANTIYYQQFLINMGRAEEALELGKRALETDPLHHGIYLETGLSHFFLGQYQEAEDVLKEGLKLNPSILDLHNKLGKVYLNTGRYDEAIDELESGLDLSSVRPPSMLAYLAIAQSRKGQVEAAQEIEEELRQRRSNGEKGIALFLAHIWSGLGDNERALEYLETAYDEHEVDLIWLKVEPQFEDLRDQPRFMAILKGMGFPE